MPDTRRAALRIDRLRVSHGDHGILDGIDLDVPGGRTLAILGASGCGKTTLLKSIAGLLPIQDGTIELGSLRIESLPPRERGAVYLFQEPLLFPHLNVYENVAFGLRLRGLDAPVLARRVEAMLLPLGLAALAARRPTELSGGQRQRVAFGRALIVEPALLLLDEPFSSLDPEARSEMQELFRATVQSIGITAIFVTHDLKESLRVGDAFATLAHGRLQHYPDRASFCESPASGVRQEADFWNAIATGSGARS